MSALFVEAVNRRGGHAELLNLRDAGAYGNTHFPMSDLNNVQIADLYQNISTTRGSTSGPIRAACIDSGHPAAPWVFATTHRQYSIVFDSPDTQCWLHRSDMCLSRASMRR
jgi:hypothetical protein